MNGVFKDLAEAGRLPAEALGRHALHAPVVVALPRGGVPVAAEIARALRAPLELALVRKIGAPGQPELAVGAVVDGEHPDVVIDAELAERTGADADYLEASGREALVEIGRRRNVYQAGHAPVPIEGRDVVVVDDGVATGSTMKVALRGLRRGRPARLIVCVPVAPLQAMHDLHEWADMVVCLSEPECFGSVGQYYANFQQLTDDEVIACLQDARERLRERSTSGSLRS